MDCVAFWRWVGLYTSIGVAIDRTPFTDPQREMPWKRVPFRSTGGSSKTVCAFCASRPCGRSGGRRPWQPRQSPPSTANQRGSGSRQGATRGRQQPGFPSAEGHSWCLVGVAVDCLPSRQFRTDRQEFGRAIGDGTLLSALARGGTFLRTETPVCGR